jgi:hypothetical protein
MKYCPECGFKNEPSNGQPPKFCMDCGHSFGAVARASVTATIQREPEPEIEAPTFEIQGGGFSIHKAEDLIGQGPSKSVARRAGGKSLDDLRSYMKQQTVIEEK